MKNFDNKIDISQERENFKKQNHKFIFSIQKRMDMEKNKQQILKQLMQKIKHTENNVKSLQQN